MRIVSGKYKGKRFNPPKKFPSRPTTDFAKESLFNILENQFYIEDLNVLDLFAGTGNISLEFISRGAKGVLSIDKHPVCIRHLHQLKNEVNEDHWLISRKDVFKFLEPSKSGSTDDQYDLIFADPPFADKSTSELPDLIFNSGLLSKDGCLIIEHGRENNFEEHPRFQNNRNYGGVNFSFFA